MGGRIKQVDVCDVPGKCSVLKMHGVGWVFPRGLVIHSSLWLSKPGCTLQDLEAARLISRRWTLPSPGGDLLPYSHCPDSNWVCLWSGSHIPWSPVPCPQGLCPSLSPRIFSCTQSQLVAWPCDSCLCSLLAVTLERNFERPGPPSGGEDLPSPKQRERSMRQVVRSRVCPVGSLPGTSSAVIFPTLWGELFTYYQPLSTLSSLPPRGDEGSYLADG